MCYDEGTLQAYLDREFPGRKRWEIEAHIATCASCKQKLVALEKANKAARDGLSALSQDLHSSKIETEPAWQRLTMDERFGIPAQKKGVFEMANSRLKLALAPIAVAIAIVVALSFAPVRTIAADLLNIFRVEKVETINISAKDIEEMHRLSGNPNGGKIDIENLGKIESSGFKAPTPISLAGAKEAVDFNLRLPEGIDGFGDAQLNVQQGFATSFTLNIDKANETIKSFGGEKLLPAALDGKKFTVRAPTVVIANYPKNTGGMVTIAQARSPEFILPDGVDAVQVRDVLLSLPVLPDNIRSQLEAIKDWRNTLVIPNIDGSSEKVTVDGTEGVFMKPPKQVNGDSMLVWQKDGVIYGISGTVTLEQAQAIAESMK